MASSWDVGSVYFTGGPVQEQTESSPKLLEKRFVAFLKEYREDAVYVYRYVGPRLLNYYISSLIFRVFFENVVIK